MNAVAFDHAIIFVPNLSQAINQFTRLGFNVMPGGEHDHTHNALIIFNDRSYIELLALKPTWYRPLLRVAVMLGIISRIAEGKLDVSWRLMRWITQRYGAIDWCISVDNVDAALEYLKPFEVSALQSQTQQRQRPDGKVARWILGSPKNLDLPFLIHDETPVEIRAPMGDHTKHPNGAQFIKQLNISLTQPRPGAQHVNNVVSNGSGVDDSLNDSVNRLMGFLSALAAKNCVNQHTIELGKTTICVAKQSDAMGKFSLELSYDGDKPQQLDCGNATIWLIPNSGSD